MSARTRASWIPPALFSHTPCLLYKHSALFISVVAEWHHQGAILPLQGEEVVLLSIIFSLLEIPGLKPLVQWKELEDEKEDAEVPLP